MTGVQLDGAALIDHVFAIDKPMLSLNTLRTESEKSEHKGFALLLKGCFGANPEPTSSRAKDLWKEGEDDAVDYLTLLSLLHRKLDDAVPVRKGEASDDTQSDRLSRLQETPANHGWGGCQNIGNF